MLTLASASLADTARKPTMVRSMSKDTVRVNDEGCRLVGWYLDWREPYVANYTL